MSISGHHCREVLRSIEVQPRTYWEDVLVLVKPKFIYNFGHPRIMISTLKIAIGTGSLVQSCRIR